MLFAKRIGLVILLFVLSLASAFVWAEITKTLLVSDMKNEVKLPKNFRSTNVIPQDKNNIDWNGFTELNIAGSAEFSEKSLPEILQALKVPHITIVDLRQESHGFLNGDSVSWYAPQDAGNEKLTNDQINKSEQARLRLLESHRKVKVYDILSKTDDGFIENTKSNRVTVRNVSSEQSVAEKNNLNYFRLYIQDFHAPKATEVDRFITFYNKLSSNDFLLFHCRAGVGRTTTFMVMFDMLRNAKQVSFDQILSRQAAIGGKDVTELPVPGSFKYKAAVERMTFLKKFYQYAKTNTDNFTTSWTEWNEKN